MTIMIPLSALRCPRLREDRRHVSWELELAGVPKERAPTPLNNLTPTASIASTSLKEPCIQMKFKFYETEIACYDIVQAT